MSFDTHAAAKALTADPPLAEAVVSVAAQTRDA